MINSRQFPFRFFSAYEVLQQLEDEFEKIRKFENCVSLCTYRIRPGYRPCPHKPPPLTFNFVYTHYRPLDNLFRAFYFIFTYYRPLDDLLALVVENKFT